MVEFLKLIRWKNLIIVIATMVMVRYLLLDSLLSQMMVLSADGEMVATTLRLPWHDFLALIIAAVCLTAGGYVINDYFDIKTDLINRGTIIVGTVIPRRKAMMIHNVLNLIGVVAGFYVSWRVGYFWLGTVFLLVSGLLWFYSASYKRQFLIGNIIVGLLTALVPFMVVFYEFPALFSYYSSNAVGQPDYRLLFMWTGGFSLFAFLTTIVREIIKDIEDFEGDMEYGRHTLPVVSGIKSTKYIVTALIISIIAALYLVWMLYVSDMITLVYISAALTLPLLLTIYMVLTGRGKKHFQASSTVMKFVMLMGLLYTVVVKVILVTGTY
ncbi:MAG: geranylgeranylglycerol-phosphate geranylgeranyltransferase [Bacteroidales bacterium]|nr:geranylgeranylglycerol-phosphate geranylgeranyltransferase [Bacteroidales bacterium]